MRPTNKHERHINDQRHQHALEERVRPNRMPSYETWLRRQSLTNTKGRFDLDKLTKE